MSAPVKKTVLTLILCALFGTTIVGSLFVSVEPAHAQNIVTIGASLPETARQIFDQIWQGLKTAVLTAVSRIVAYAMRKIAYDSAVWLASGGKGQTPFAHTKSFGDYLKNVGDDALGLGIEALGQPFGFNLCKIPDIKVDLGLRLGLRTGFGNVSDPTQKPPCTFSQFINEWTSGDAWSSKFTAAGQSATEQFNQALSFDKGAGGDFGAVLQTSEALNQFVAGNVAGQTQQRQEGQGYRAKETLVSRQTLTPPGIIKKEFERNTPGDVQEKDEAQVRALLTSGEIRVIPTMLGIFLNTLVSTMVRNYQEKGVLPFGIGYKGEIAKFEGGGILGGRRSAEELFSSFLTVTIGAESEYDLLGQLGSCEGRGTYNCRADQGLIQAAQQTAGGNPVTIAEALERGWLNGSWKLIPPRRDENTDRQFCQRAYCYSNLKVLRQVRLLPLGFEIAAARSSPDRPWSLKEVVGTAPNYADGFNDCARDANGRVVYDPVSKPFCHLIDPNWVIKIPPTRCAAKGPGAAVLTTGVPTRLDDCMDLQGCVAYSVDAQGNRTCSQYGYCTREQNVWDFKADTCQPQFRTCQTYQNVATGETMSYLARTLDSAFCSEKTSGCRAYSITQTNGVWSAPTPPAAPAFQNAAILFNSNISSACSAQSPGCTAFQPAGSLTSDLRYLRKAPDYLGCYDADRGAPGVQWPKTPADLSRLPDIPLCRQYATACIPDEVGCTRYTARDNGEQIPGKATPADRCHEACVGYDAFRELPSNYSPGEPVVYLIPPSPTNGFSSGQACQATEVGCSAFTSLSATAGDLEQVEYYSFLRPCERPTDVAGKTFITYEGSVQGGFQLKTFSLVPDATGGPKHWAGAPDELASYSAVCNETLYRTKDKKLDADCRQFNDEAGRVYYRLLGHTIPVAEACTPYRLGSSKMLALRAGAIQKADCEANGRWDEVLGQCQICFQGGQYRDGFCFYNGLPASAPSKAGVSNSCTAAAETCRAYTGSRANNIQTVLPTETFENITSLRALPQWSGFNLTLSSESTRRDEHSLGAAGGGIIAARTIPVTPRQSYIISFWAKGTSGNLTAQLTAADQRFNGMFGTAGVGDVWQYYRFGPLEYAGTATSAALGFAIQPDGALFIDNLTVVAGAGAQYFVKKSLRVDARCDRNPEDNLPGEALGCRAYQNAAGAAVNLTGFSFLCREQSIGCSALLDTHNTLTNGRYSALDAGPRLYQVWVPGGSGATVVVTVDGKEVGRCAIPVGQTGCYIDTISNVEPGVLRDPNRTTGHPQVVTSTIYIPADTPTSTPLYLVNDEAGSCSETEMGCTAAGATEETASGPRFTTTIIKNDPALYGTALCMSEAMGCGQFTGAGGTAFFKDPRTTGGKICTYRTDAVVKGKQTNGWFWKDVGVCRQNTTEYCTADSDCRERDLGICAKNPGFFCQINQDCPGNDTCTHKCQGIGDQACYPDYVDGNGAFGLWSAGDAGRYQQFVGACQAEQNTCTEFLDHNDKNASRNPRAYYFLKNEKITNNDCRGQVSQKAGCALFEQTDNPAKYWSTADSYQASFAAGSILVPPVTGAQNDANTIIKVTRDRECGEWLACTRSHRVFDTNLGKYKQVCDVIGRCNSGSTAAECAGGVAGAHPNQPLTEFIYFTNFDGSWSSQDFSGYSIPGLYPLEELFQLNATSSNHYPDWRLVKRVPCGGATNCADNAPPTSFRCKTNNLACGRGGDMGLCINGTCARGVDGNGSPQALAHVPPQSCRVYPEPTAPFPYTDIVKRSQEFNQANKCDEAAKFSYLGPIGYACECNYTKAIYGDSLTRYWNYREPNSIEPLLGPREPTKARELPVGICQGGERQNKACSSDIDCYRVDDKAKQTQDGTCLRLTKQESWIGWYGYCLERDDTRTINADPNLGPCLTWWPVEALVGTLDVNNQHLDAGYQTPALGGRYYCLASPGNSFSRPLQVDEDDDPNYRRHFALRSFEFGSDGLGSGGVLQDEKYNWGYGPSHEVGNDDQFQRASLPLIDWLRDENGAPVQDLDNQEKEVLASYKFFNSDEEKISQADIERITLEVIDQSKFENDDPLLGTRFQVWPNNDLSVDSVDYVTPQVNYPKIKTRGGGEGRAAIGRYLGKKNEYVLFYSSNGDYLKNDGNVCYPIKDCSQISGNLFKSNSLKIGGQQTNSEGFWDRRFDNAQICDSDPESSGNWHAVRLRFDGKTKKFAGYDVAYCDESSSYGRIAYSIHIKIRQLCASVADATVDPKDENAGNFTVAATQRLWEQSQFFAVELPRYTYPTPYRPFGSLRLGLLGAQDWFNPFIFTRFKAPDIKDNSGCPTDGTSDCVYQGDNNKSTIVNVPPEVQFVPGVPYSCPGGKCGQTDEGGFTKISDASNQTVVFGRTVFSKLFPRVRAVRDFNTSTINRYYAGYQPTQLLPLWDLTESAVTAPPTVLPVGQCSSGGEGERCIELQTPGISLNERASGDVVSPASSFAVTLKFFGFADDNQMPLRNIMVDWDDGTPPQVFPPGFYRNHRGFNAYVCGAPGGGGERFCELKDPPGTRDNRSCSSDSDCQPQPICTANPAGFGKIEGQTCDSTYFRSDTTYYCTENGPGWAADQTICQRNGLPNGCCVFVPKVQIKDNWGWCNGSCRGGAGGCYDGQGKGECKTENPAAWTSFTGRVIVAP